MMAQFSSWALALVLLGFSACTAAAEKGQGEQVLGCMPSSCMKQRTLWQHMLDNVPPCLVASRVWWSDQPARLPVTLVTQLTMGRLDALKAQCAAWAGPLAAAIYIPLYEAGASEESQLQPANQQKLQTATAAIEQLYATAEQGARGDSNRPTASGVPHPGGCQLRILLMYEVFGEERATALYPVNALRNYARLLADTPLIANIDVDMLPSASLSTALADGWEGGPRSDQAPGPGSAVALTKQMKEQKTVYVIPAFETKCGGPSIADQVGWLVGIWVSLFVSCNRGVWFMARARWTTPTASSLCVGHQPELLPVLVITD